VDERVAVGGAAQNPRSDHVIGAAVEQSGDDPADVPRLVLAVGVAEDEVFIAVGQGELAGRLEGLGVAVVPFVVDDQDLPLGGDPDGAVGAAVVDDQDVPAREILVDLIQDGTDLPFFVFRRESDQDIFVFPDSRAGPGI
jgi:hypothetical protein